MFEKLKKASRFMATLLRHKPERRGLSVDSQGWVTVSTLLEALNITKEGLDWIVDNNDKQRFEYSPHGDFIRACQGHSLKHVKITYERVKNPPILYHGTSKDAAKKIMNVDGIKSMNRTHVHLSDNLETAQKVAERHDKVDPHIFIVKTFGLKIYKSGNGVYLCEHVPVENLISAL